MTSIVGITALQELRKFKGFENAIIAGGFVRDSLMGGTFKDLDIFVPVASPSHFKKLVESHFKEIEPIEKGLDVLVPEKDIDTWLKERNESGIFDKYIFDFDHINRQYHIYDRENKQKKYDKKIGNFTELTLKKKDSEGRPGYGSISPSYVSHYDGKYMNFLDVDICGYVYQTSTNFNGEQVVDDFGDKLVAEFSYDIDKVYFDGSTTVQTQEFLRDSQRKEATLTQLKDIASLPYAMAKFNRLKEKYPDLVFRSTVLEIKKKEEETSHKQEKQFKSGYKYPAWDIRGARADANRVLGNFVNFNNVEDGAF